MTMDDNARAVDRREFIKRISGGVIGAGLAGSLTGRNAAAAEAPKPNFVFINIDDLGYADIGPFGSTLNRTPNLDRMAAEGRRLTTFYAAPVCSPSRAALMTGCYPKRALPIPHVLFPGNDVGLARAEITVAEVLKSAGYATGLVGKWHLGDQPEFLPTRQGFDEWFGLPYSNDMGPASDGVKSNFGDPLPPTPKNPQPPLPLMRGETVVQRVLATDQTQLVARYTDEALRFIREHKDGRFFLYLAHNAVHFPLYPGERFRGKSANGLYGDWIEEMDWSVGEVLSALRTHGIAEKTLVIFTSDNGGTPRAVNRPLRGFKGSTWEGGVRVPTIAWWPGRIPAGTSSDAICGMFDVLPTFAALGGAMVPGDRKIDGADIRSILMGDPATPPPHGVFYYYRGLQLEAVRDLEWKLVLPAAAASAAGKAQAKGGAKAARSAQLFNLKTDIGESSDVAAQHPEIVARLEKLVAQMKDDLGTSGPAPGSRPLGKVENPQPLIGHDGKVRPGFEPKSKPDPRPEGRKGKVQ
jgi:arylsulfatase A